MTQFEARLEEKVKFYLQNYVFLLRPLTLEPGSKIFLEASIDDTCRFCGQSKPTVSFRSAAHAIPECLGNKRLFTKYECDTCNLFFGRTIENDLGVWSKIDRAISHIPGKGGVPILKKAGPNQSYRIEYKTGGFSIKDSSENPVTTIDEEAKMLTIQLEADSYTPVAVLKALTKIGLTLLPEIELRNFSDTLSWIRQEDHKLSRVKACPVISTFLPGPMPDNVLSLALLRRRESVTSLFYLFLILGFGNRLLQVCLPCPEKDKDIAGQTLSIPAYPPLYYANTELYGYPKWGLIDLCDTEKTNRKTMPVSLGFDRLENGESSK